MFLFPKNRNQLFQSSIKLFGKWLDHVNQAPNPFLERTMLKDAIQDEDYSSQYLKNVLWTFLVLL